MSQYFNIISRLVNTSEKHITMTLDSTKQLNYHQDLIRTVQLYPNIHIVHIAGDPPNSYKITFQEPTFGQSNNSTPTKSHTFTFSLDDDFPKSSPIITATTPKDDPTLTYELQTLCNKWSTIGSLSNLVIHAGMTILNYNPKGNNTQLDSSEHKDVDLLLPEIAEEPFAINNRESEQTINAANKNRLISFIKQKKYFAANTLFAQLQEDLSKKESTKFEHIIGEQILKSNELHKKIIDNHKQNKHDEAKKLYLKLSNTTPDFPGLPELKETIKNSNSEPIKLFLEKEEQKEPDFDLPEDSLPTEPILDTKYPSNEKKTIAPKHRGKPKNIYKITLITTCFIIILLTIFSTLIYKDYKILKYADDEWKQGLVLITELKHKKALELFEQTKNKLETVNILFLKKQEFLKKISNLTVSKDFIEGLHGRILYKGKYLAIDKVEKLEKLNTMLQHADQLTKNNFIKEAIEEYENARLYATSNAAESNLLEIQQKLNNLRLEATLSEAKDAENKNNWDNLTNIYQRALALAELVSEQTKNQALENSLHQRLTFAIFKQNISKSKKKFADKRWKETIELLEIAQEALSEWPNSVTPQEQEELNNLLNRARLYLSLNEAKKAYESAQWKVAANKYHNILKLLKNTKSLDHVKLDNFMEKVKKTLFMAELAELLSEAANAENQNTFPLAINYYKTVIRIAEESLYKDTKWAKNIIANTKSQIIASENQEDTNNKTDWLLKNYLSIFKKFFNIPNSSKLLYPSVTFIGKEEENKIFKISCIEKYNGKPARLILDYQYITNENRWRLRRDQ